MTISRFSGKHAFLSNFYLCEVTYDGGDYPSVEHAYQAAKAIDPQERLEIARCSTPARAKRLGQRVKMYNEWDQMKLDVMLVLLSRKFVRERALWLVGTHPEELIEGNNGHDNFWGTCVCEQCGNRGYNHLGKLLMVVRDQLMKGK